MRPVLSTCVALGICLFSAQRVSAQSALLAATDPTKLGEVTLAKVMADDSSLWLSVLLEGRTRLVLVTADSAVETAPAADAWLDALDSATRVRVAPPPGPVSCGSNSDLGFADSGMSHATLAVAQVVSAASEVELRRALEAEGLDVDVARLARFTGAVQPPFRLTIYDAPALGGQTAALRLLEHGHPSDLPPIVNAASDTVALDLIALASDAVLPEPQAAADPSEFAIIYHAATTSSDYPAARARWLTGNAGRWLTEARNSSAVFAWTVLPPHGQVAPVVARYFDGLGSARASVCESQVRAAYARHSQHTADFVCDANDDLARSLEQLGFADLRLNRLFGALAADGATFSVGPAELQTPLVLATDFDSAGCPSVVPSTPVAPGAGMPNGGGSQPVVIAGGPDDGVYYPPDVVVDTSGSCSGDSSSSDSSNDSCSGDSSSDDSSNDSCSGDSSSDDSSNDSGCGKSDYDGDTCSGSSKSSASSQSSALVSGTSGKGHKPRRVHLSLLTLLAAALALPLRRLRALRL